MKIPAWSSAALGGKQRADIGGPEDELHNLERLSARPKRPQRTQWIDLILDFLKIRSASVKKGASGSGGIDDAQEMNAATRSGTIHRLRPPSASLSAASLPASPLCAATWRPSMPARYL